MSLERRAVVSRPVEVQSRAVILPAGELVRIAVGGAAGGGAAKGLVVVAGRNRPARTDESYRGAKCIGQEGRGRGVGAREILVDPQPRQQIRDYAVGAVHFLHRIQAVVEELRRGPADGLVHPAAEGVVDEAAHGGPPLRYLGQMVARVPVDVTPITLCSATVRGRDARKTLGFATSHRASRYLISLTPHRARTSRALCRWP